MKIIKICIIFSLVSLLMAQTNSTNSTDVKCFFDISIDGGAPQRLVFLLYTTITPKSAENFRALCTGEKGFGYKGTAFYRILPTIMMQGGDVTNNNGTGGKSIYGGNFEDENFKVKFNKPYLLAYYSTGPNTNNSNFFITTAASSSLNNRFVAFGEVIEGMSTLAQLALSGTNFTGKMKRPCIISDCGVL